MTFLKKDKKDEFTKDDLLTCWMVPKVKINHVTARFVKTSGQPNAISVRFQPNIWPKQFQFYMFVLVFWLKHLFRPKCPFPAEIAFFGKKFQPIFIVFRPKLTVLAKYSVRPNIRFFKWPYFGFGCSVVLLR